MCLGKGLRRFTELFFRDVRYEMRISFIFTLKFFFSDVISARAFLGQEMFQFIELIPVRRKDRSK